jgi:hypothetical protein
MASSEKVKNLNMDAQKDRRESEDSGASSPKKRNHKHRQFKSLFEPRQSPFNFESLFVDKHPMRGFVVLFWVAVAFKIIGSMYNTWKITGYPFSFGLLNIMFANAHDGFMVDISMVLSMYAVVLFQKLISWRIIPLGLAGYLQHILQALWFLGFASHIFVQKFSWVKLI